MTKLVTIGLVCAAMALGQTKISGTGKCEKPDPQHVVEVGDRAGHAMVLVKQTCTWTTPIEMEGVKGKTYTAIVTSDASGPKGQDRGYVVITMENGDKAFVRFSGASMSDKDGNPISGEGTWSYTGGTGKFKGITGKGTYKAKGGEEMIEGEYSIAAPAPAKKK
jgi:hypothetical protein